jgi:hypothetical protein
MGDRRRRARPIRTALACILACSALGGCYTYPPAQPAPPPPPRSLTISPQRRQSQAQQDRDNSACQSMASGQANSSESWAQIYTACMGGRGYLVQ